MSTYINYAQINSLEEFAFIAGTSYTLNFTAYDSDGVTPLDLGGATIKWVLTPYGQSYNVLQITGVITGTSTFSVTITSADTASLSGKYIQQPVIIAFTGEVYRSAQGVVLILPAIPLN